MTVATSYAPLSYSGNGSTTVFPITWPFFATTDIVVILVDSAGIEATKTLSTHYTISGGTTVDGLPSTGSLTMLTAPAAGETLRVYRSTNKVQAAVWTNGGSFQAKTVEATADRLMLIAQEIAASDAGGGGGSLIDGAPLMFESSGADPDYFDARNSIIRNVADPIAGDDAVNKSYGDTNYGGAAAASASASAASAASSATAANAAKTAAEAAFDAFDDRYLGAKSSDPIVDNDGSDLVDGALYFNIAAKRLRAYDAGTDQFYSSLGTTRTPEDFGAVGDGITDDLAALNLAIAWAETSGGEIVFGPKSYAISNTLRIKKGGVTLTGVAGAWPFGIVQPYGTRLRWIGGAGAVAVQIDPDGALAPYVMASNVMRGFTIDCNNTAAYGIKLGSTYAATLEDIAIVGAQSVGVWTTTTWNTGGHLNYRTVLRKVAVSGLASSATGFLFDGPANVVGGYNTSFLSGHDLHVTHTNGTAFFLRKCDDVHLFNIAGSRTSGGTGTLVRFYGSISEQRMATGNAIWGVQGSGGSGSPYIYVDYDAADPASPYTPRNNKVFCTAVDYQINVSGPGAHMLGIEDIGSYDVSVAPYARTVPTTFAAETIGTNDVVMYGGWERRTTGTAASGIGIGLALKIENAAGTLVEAGRIAHVLTDATASSEDAELRLYGMSAGTLVSMAQINGVGIGVGRSPTAVFDGVRSVASAVMLRVENQSSDAAASAGADFTSPSGSLSLRRASATGGDHGMVTADGAGGLSLDAHHASGAIMLRTGATPTTSLLLDSAQHATFAKGITLSSGIVSATLNANSSSLNTVTNNDAGALAKAGNSCTANSGTLQMFQVSTAAGGYGYISSNGSGGLYIDTLASAPINLRPSGSGSNALIVATTYAQSSREMRVGGDTGGASSHTTITNTNDLSANSTGTGAVKMKGSTSRDSAGFAKIYIGTTAYYVPVWSAISG